VTRHPPQSRIARRKYPGKDWRDYRLTAHFTLGEFFPPDSTQPPADWMHACRQLALLVLEPLRARYGVCIVVSGYRTPARNRIVGGAPRSFHVYEWHPGTAAADVVFRNGQPRQWGEAAAHTPAGGIGTYAAHLHVDLRSERTIWASQAG
jgi:uncharacterized protein YcbK (DUF882 family)